MHVLKGSKYSFTQYNCSCAEIRTYIGNYLATVKMSLTVIFMSLLFKVFSSPVQAHIKDAGSLTPCLKILKEAS